MNTQSTEDRADEALRTLLTQADPEAGAPQSVPTHLLDRVRAAAASDEAPATPSTPADSTSPTTSLTAHTTTHPSFLARHWQGMLMAAAGVATLALAAGSILPGLTAGSGSDSVAASIGVSDSSGGSEAANPDKATSLDGSVAAPEAARDEAASSQAVGPTSGVPGADATQEALVRSGSVLVGAEDPEAARDKFVATILAMGGRVTSESVVTEGSGGVQPYGPEVSMSRDMGMSYPYPWYPTGPGIWLTVQVPVDDYDEAMEAARDAGEVVQMQQSTYDVGAQVADVDARIKALEASLVRLTALMDEATDITDVITLEQAISQRQSELDALRAQQRDLANQTAMSQISLTLMSPEDAQNSVDPQPQQTWWESFLEGLGQFWSWFGQALLIISPLLIAFGIIAWVRRRRTRPAAPTTPPTPQPTGAPGASGASGTAGSPEASPAADAAS